jgi:hypothetical protein
VVARYGRSKPGRLTLHPARCLARCLADSGMETVLQPSAAMFLRGSSSSPGGIMLSQDKASQGTRAQARSPAPAMSARYRSGRRASAFPDAPQASRVGGGITPGRYAST